MFSLYTGAKPHISINICRLFIKMRVVEKLTTGGSKDDSKKKKTVLIQSNDTVLTLQVLFSGYFLLREVNTHERIRHD